MKTKIIFSLVCVIYALLIFTNTRFFSPFDDTGFLAADDAGRWYGFELISGGRFFPLHGAELHLFRWLFPDRIGFLTVTYGFSALTFLLCGYFLYPFFKRIKSSTIKWLFGFFLIVLIFSPAMTAPFFRVLYAERYLLLLFLIISNLFFFKKRNIFWSIQFIIVGTIAIFLKETAAVTMTLLAFSLIIFSKNNYEKIASAVISLVGIIFFSVYIFFVIPRVSDLYQSADADFIPGFIFAVKAIIEWFFSDTVLMVSLCCIFLVIGFLVLVNRKITMKPLVIIGGCAVMYMLVLLGTNIGYASHYATPIYGFLVPLLLISFARDEIDLSLKKVALSGFIFLQLGNLFPGINIILTEKFVNKTLFSVVEKLKNNPPRRLYVYTGADWGDHYVMGMSYFLMKNGTCFPIVTNEHMRQESVIQEFYKMDDFFLDNFCSFNKDERIPVLFFNQKPQFEKGDQVLVTPFSKTEIINSVKFELKNKNSIQWNKNNFFRKLNTKDAARILIKNTRFSKYMRNKDSGVVTREIILYTN